jgi:hypothetical protein
VQTQSALQASATLLGAFSGGVFEASHHFRAMVMVVDSKKECKCYVMGCVMV